MSSISLAGQVRIMKAQINSPEANFTLFEKMQYLHDYFRPDPDFSQEAINIVIGDISKQMKENDGE